MTRGYDVVVVGAGPAGIAAAAGFAQRGADVLLLEAAPEAKTRLAGEWLHPRAATALSKLRLLEALPRSARQTGHGFAFFSDDGSAPVLLPYAEGQRALALEHSVLVDALRTAVAAAPRVTYVPHARVHTLSAGTLDYTQRGTTHHVRAGLVVGADGRSSFVRAALLGPRHAPPAVSHMAGVLLEDVTLPYEDHGHVLLGGPGPLLMYRVSERHVRLCLDVPAGSAARTPEAIYHAFAPVLPSGLRRAFRGTLEHGKVTWAANRLTPRSHYGAGDVALVGDAVGTTHPLSAAGMSLGILDAMALVGARDVRAYAQRRSRESHVPEVLARALYEVVTRDDESATAVRDAMVRMWRRSPRERARTMHILSGQDPGRASFAAAFTKVAGGALAASVAMPGVVTTRAARVGALGEWARYPLMMVPARASRVGDRSPARETPTAPREFVDKGADAARSRTPQDRTTHPSASVGDAARTNAPLDHATLARLRAKAWAIAGPVSGGTWPRAPQVRRAVRALLTDVGALRRAGAHRKPALRDEHALTSAVVLSALLDGRCADTDAIVGVARGLTAGFPYSAQVAPQVEHALRRYAAHVSAAPRVQRPALRAAPDGTLSGPDWDFCQAALEGVSRSFAKPIAALPPSLRAAVTCGYLLCRVADTIEDAPNESATARDEHFERFMAALEGRGRATDFERELGGWPGTEAELELAAGLSQVIRVLDATPAPMAAAVRRWVAEMVFGMRVYAHRDAGRDGLRAPLTVSDLERYCYFVAGTVGHMLTDLFLLHMGPEAAPLEATLRARAESFGAGLQLVNILKDVTDDRARGWSFVPRELTDLDALSLAVLLDETERAQAHSSIAPLFDLATRKLDDALTYTLAIPPEHLGIRLFCLLPVFMAARTLVLARGNDDVFRPGRPVKIPRDEVEELATTCLACVRSDDALRAAYAALWQPTVPTQVHQPFARGEHV
ncbi:MAG: squalene/phytoene synthase family protein [Myxococcales bacterium]|nr:squalene/phytoene synthase family protein [Myxococcales bacterium]